MQRERERERENEKAANDARAHGVRVAIAQTASVFGDAAATLTKVAEWAGRAAEGGAQLLLFPEAFVGGYPKGADFHIFVGARTSEGRDEFRLYYEGAIEVPGPETDQLARISARHHLELVIGVVERDGGTLYCTVLFFDPEGGLRGKHRKLMPTAAERYIWGFGDGATLPVFDTSLGKVGAVICWENYMPMLRMAMYGKGIQIYCAPTADDRPTWTSTMQHVAMEGRCFVLSAAQVIRRRDLPAGLHNELAPPTQPDAILMRGGSCIVSPMGAVLAGPLFDEEGLLIADLDRRDIVRGKFDFDVAGHYARPDIFRLTVNESAAAPVTYGAANAPHGTSQIDGEASTPNAGSDRTRADTARPSSRGSTS